MVFDALHAARMRRDERRRAPPGCGGERGEDMRSLLERTLAYTTVRKKVRHTPLSHPSRIQVHHSQMIFHRSSDLFFDTDDSVLLMRACRVLEYPRVPLVLLVQAFLGPRTRRADGHHSALILVSNGLVAFFLPNIQTNHLARALPTTTTDVPSLLFMISRCTRKALQDRLCTDSANQRLSCSTLLVRSKLACLLRMWLRDYHTRHCSQCVLRLSGKAFRYFLNQTCMGFGCGCFFWYYAGQTDYLPFFFLRA